MAELNRRLTINGDIVYPITKAGNVIQLQKTIRDMTPIPVVSDSQPTSKVFGSQWFDTSEQDDFTEAFTFDSLELYSFGLFSSDDVTFGEEPEELSFGDTSEELTFGEEPK